MPFTALDELDAHGDVLAFAAANGLRYDDVAEPPALGPGILELVSSGMVSGRVSSVGWEVGNLTGGTRSTSETKQLWGMTVEVHTSLTVPAPAAEPIGYLSVTLARHLPNMILDSRRNEPAFGSSLFRVPMAFQRLSLEGDFDRHFELYAPAGYERDALYVFTPDLMALMIDEASPFDIEIRDNQLVVYSRGGLDLRRAATWMWVDRVVSVVGRKTFERTDLYSDDRLAPLSTQAVAPEGARLRRSLIPGQLSKPMIVVLVASAVIVFGMIASTVLASSFP